jgi:transposase-like protein
MAEPPRGWKAELAREHGVAASAITARIKAMEAAQPCARGGPHD